MGCFFPNFISAILIHFRHFPDTVMDFLLLFPAGQCHERDFYVHELGDTFQADPVVHNVMHCLFRNVLHLQNKLFTGFRRQTIHSADYSAHKLVFQLSELLFIQISNLRKKRFGIMMLPMPFYVEEECFYEGVSITREEFFDALNNGKKVSTSQQSPNAVMELWREGLKEYEQILYIPMSSGLSGSCNTAMVLAEEEEFDGKVFVVDNGRIATPLHRSILDALEMAEEGMKAEEIKDALELSRNQMSIYLGVETLEFLKKGGRITPATAAIGTLLNIKPVLKLDVGVLETYRKCRGMKKARREMLEAMKQDLEVTFREYYEKGEVYLMAASSADEETTAGWIQEIQEYFSGMEVMCDNLSLGISCHTGEGALGIGCSCRPRR